MHKWRLVGAGRMLLYVVWMLCILFPLIHMYSALSLSWTQLVETWYLRSWWGLDLEQNIWRGRFCLHVYQSLSAPYPIYQVPWSGAILCESGSLCVERGEVMGELEASYAESQACPLRLCCWEGWRGGCCEGVACRSLGHPALHRPPPSPPSLFYCSRQLSQACRFWFPYSQLQSCLLLQSSLFLRLIHGWLGRKGTIAQNSKFLLLLFF